MIFILRLLNGHQIRAKKNPFNYSSSIKTAYFYYSLCEIFETFIPKYFNIRSVPKAIIDPSAAITRVTTTA